MGLVQRVTLISVLLACVAAAALLIGWAREPHMALLYSRLDPEDAAEVVAKIQEDGTEYELKDGGTSIYVPSEKVYALRLQLAGEGLPTGGQQGYRILDTEKIGTSPFTQRINYIRALEGELARTITLIDGVEHARIHVVRTESRLFREDEAGTSATVAVRLRPGRRLSQGNVAAIVHMVAGAVDHLSPENVVVVDSQGTLLSTGAESNFAGGTGGTVLDYKTQVEEYLARKAEQMLTLVLGPGRATVKVSAEVETSTVNKTKEEYSPDGGVPVKEEVSSKSEAPAPTGQGAGGGESKEETITTEYQVGRTVEQTINMPGKILSLSVAAFVDLSPPETAAETPAEEGEEPAEPAATPAPTLSTQDVEDVVRRAIGLTETDELKVVSTRFHRPAAIGEEAAESDFLSDPAFYLDVARHASLGILVIGALLALKMFGGSRRKAPSPATVGAGGAEGAVAGGEDGLGGNLLPAGTGLPADAAQVNRRIAAALKENPDEVKRLFRTWVQQQQGAA
jgi:flagellar M-ring protein FliF